jgi:integrase
METTVNRRQEMNDYRKFQKEGVTKHGTFVRKGSKTGIFTWDELARLFSPKLYTDKALYLYYLCCLSGTLWMGEARGLRLKQILLDRNALIVDGFVKNDGKRIYYNRKRTEEHPKFRIVPLPDIILNLLREHITEQQVSEDGFIFKGQKEPDKPITACYVQDNLKRIMKKTGIEPKGRRLMVQSFCFTSMTYIREVLPVNVVIKPVVGRVIRMTDYYNKRQITESLPRLFGTDTATANLFN